MSKFALARADGTVSIMTLVEGTDPKDELAKWHPDDAKTVVAIHPVEDKDIPADRTFRNAWTVKAGRVIHDMKKARNLHRDKMRVARGPKLAALDAEYQRADEKGDTAAKAVIAVKKQTLRDVTKHPDIERAATPDQLKAVWPDNLKEK